MNTYPFSIYKRADRPFFLVSFKNADGKFLAGISTKKKSEDEAVAVAFQWLRDGVPQKKEAFNTHEQILKEATKKIKTKNEAEATVDIDAFISHMGIKDLSASRRNCVIKAGTVALRWAFTKGRIEQDPTRGHLLFSGDEAKRNILTPTAASAAFRVIWKNERAKLANMLASVTGMRSGEILALRFQDIGPDCLYVKHSWNWVDKIKLTKNNESRTVEVPFPILIQKLFEQAKKNPWGVSPDSFVFWTEYAEGVPMQPYHFVNGLKPYAH